MKLIFIFVYFLHERGKTEIFHWSVSFFVSCACVLGVQERKNPEGKSFFLFFLCGAEIWSLDISIKIFVPPPRIREAKTRKMEGVFVAFVGSNSTNVGIYLRWQMYSKCMSSSSSSKNKRNPYEFLIKQIRLIRFHNSKFSDLGSRSGKPEIKN